MHTYSHSRAGNKVIPILYSVLSQLSAPNYSSTNDSNTASKNKVILLMSKRQDVYKNEECFISLDPICWFAVHNPFENG
jgi:hypothetical protein